MISIWVIVFLFWFCCISLGNLSWKPSKTFSPFLFLASLPLVQALSILSNMLSFDKVVPSDAWDLHGSSLRANNSVQPLMNWCSCSPPLYLIKGEGVCKYMGSVHSIFPLFLFFFNLGLSLLFTIEVYSSGAVAARKWDFGENSPGSAHGPWGTQCSSIEKSTHGGRKREKHQKKSSEHEKAGKYLFPSFFYCCIQHP